MEVKMNKEIRDYQESMFMGLDLRQCVCSVLAILTAVGIYFGMRDITGQEITGWLCVLGAAPFAACDYNFISNYCSGGACTARTACISQTNLCNYAFEYIIRISIYREAGTLAFYYTAYISFIHIGYYLHLCQVGSNGEQCRSFESGSNGLSCFHITADDYSVNR